MFAQNKPMPNSPYHYLCQVPDHRRAEGIRTPIGAFMEMIILANMAGRFAIRAMNRFIFENEEFFVD